MELAHIPLSDLKVSPLNMRHAKKAPDISDILPSIRARGVQQPLLVRKNDSGYEIVAGRRRFHCLKKIEKEGGDVAPVPCAIMAEDDDATALEASLIENVARLAPDEMTRFETFARLQAEGRNVQEISTIFGVTEIMVKRSLALGSLLPEIRKAYREGDIDPETIRHLTLATEKQQADWLKLFDDPEQREPRGSRLKQWLFGSELKLEAALFSPDAYSGEIVTDLFGDSGYFSDADLFWQLQNKAIAERCEALKSDGWQETVLLEPGAYFQRWDHVETEKQDGGRIYVEVRPNGEVTFHEGYLTRKEHERRLKNLDPASEEDSETSAVRPELTAVAQNYIELHRHAAVRLALLRAPQLALRAIAAHAICGSDLWQVRPEPQKADRETTAESLANSKAQAAFDSERSQVLALLGFTEESKSLARPYGTDTRIGALLAKLIALSDDEILRVLTFVMAETLSAGSSITEQIGNHLAVDMAKLWEPEDAFFDLLRDKSALHEILVETGGREVANAKIGATAKVHKQAIRDSLNTRKDDGENPSWLPRYLKFPFAAYTNAGAGRLGDMADRAKKHSG
ncbi:ParB/RepB/Spo0J family partition protein [Roseibium sp. M-1]